MCWYRWRARRCATRSPGAAPRDLDHLAGEEVVEAGEAADPGVELGPQQEVHLVRAEQAVRDREAGCKAWGCRSIAQSRAPHPPRPFAHKM